MLVATGLNAFVWFAALQDAIAGVLMMPFAAAGVTTVAACFFTLFRTRREQAATA